MAAGTTTQQIVDVLTPAAGESVTEGTILEWHAKVGETIKTDETIVEISTDKVDVELPSPATGTVTEILVAEGDVVTVGQVIARIAVGAADAASTGGAMPAAPAAPAATPSTEIPASTRISPVAARAAAAEGVNPAGLAGSGPAGRILKDDVLAAAKAGGNGHAASAPASAPTQAPAGESKPMRGAAAMLAKYMDESRSVPTATSFRTIAVSTLDARRRELKAAGRKVSFTHLIAYAIVSAAKEMPVMAEHFAEVDGKPYRVSDGTVNLGLAVDVERKDGTRTLMVPVIRNASALSFESFLAAYDALVEKARTNTLQADDLAGANITLTNPGGIGTIASVPRLMSGQGTIVATGSIAFPPGLAHIGAQIGAEKVMTMTSTYDHRVIQGAESGRFLALIEERLQGEHDFYEQAFAALGVSIGPAPRQPVASAAPASPAAGTAVAPPDEKLLAAVNAAATMLSRIRSHGHLAAHLDPLGSEPAGDPQLDPAAVGLTPDLMAQIPARILETYVPGDTFADAVARLREILLRHDRLRGRAHRLPPPARVAAREDRVRHLQAQARPRKARGAAAAAGRG